VDCLDNFSTGTHRNLQSLADIQSFHVLNADVTEDVSASGPVDLVFHCALPAANADHLATPLESLHTVSQGTTQALAVAHRNRCRFVLVSSSDVYGPRCQDPQPEHAFDPVDPSDAANSYVVARRFAESLTAAHRAFLGVDTAIVRVFNTYGPRMRSEDALLPRLISEALSGAPLLIPGSGTHNYPLCYVDDVVRGILDVAFGTTPGPVNLGDPRGLPIVSLAMRVAALARSGSPLKYVAFPAAIPRVPRPDTSLAEHLFGWRPQTGLSDGLGATIAAVRAAEPIPA
jgi:dTDP-glucose 4,6-dehydratase